LRRPAIKKSIAGTGTLGGIDVHQSGGARASPAALFADATAAFRITTTLIER